MRIAGGCLFCGVIETTNHSFIHCGFAQELWNYFRNGLHSSFLDEDSVGYLACQGFAEVAEEVIDNDPCKDSLVNLIGKKCYNLLEQ